MQKWAKTFLILFLFGFLLYANGLNNKFLWDDYYILNSPLISQTKFILSQWDPANNKYFTGYYRPLAQMVYAFCYDTFKDNYWQYHLLNLALFVFLCTLICLLLTEISGNFYLALLASLFFLIHPMNGIMVNNIVTSVLSLQLIFMLGAILLLWKSLEKGNNRILYFLSLFIAFLSLFWYDLGVMTPVYLSAVIVIFRKDPLKAKVLYLFPYFLISFCYFLFKSFFIKGISFIQSVIAFHMTIGEYVATLSKLLIWYLKKLLFLKGIVMQWATPVVHQNIFLYCLAMGGVILIFLILLMKFYHEKIILMSLAWILIGFAPLCVVEFGISNPGVGVILEPHWMIFSMLGLSILLAYFFMFLMDRMKTVGLVLLFILVFAYCSSTRAYNQIWSDEKTYASYWAQGLPQYKLIDVILGDAYRMEGNIEESRKYYKLSNHGSQINANSCVNIGTLDMQQEHWKDAEKDFELAIMIDPHSSPAYCNLGYLYLRQNKLDKAREFFFKALDYDPYMQYALDGLANVYIAKSQYSQAIQLCFKSLEIKKDDPSTLIILIYIYLIQKDEVDVKNVAFRIIKNVNDPGILTKLGAILAINNMTDLALGCYDKIIKVSPRYENAYLDEGILFMRMGHYDRAITVWQDGSRLFPADKRFRNYIDKVKVMDKK